MSATCEWCWGGFVRHYNEARPHRTLTLEVPRGEYVCKHPPNATRVRSREILGGLLHEYQLDAASRPGSCPNSPDMRQRNSSPPSARRSVKLSYHIQGATAMLFEE